MKRKRALTGLGLAAGLVAGGGAGFLMEMSGSAGASSAPDTTTVAPSTDDTADDPATTDEAAPEVPAVEAPAAPVPPDGSSDTDRAEARKAALLATLQPLIDDGTITQAQADAVIAKLAEAGPFGGPGRPGGFGVERGGGGVKVEADVIATTLGITADEVRTAIESGQTIAELAVSKGKTAQDVIDAIVAEAKTRLDAKVASGDLTQAEADTRLAEQTTLITTLVNETPPSLHRDGPGGRGKHIHGEKPAPDEEKPATTPSATTPSTTVPADTSGS